MKIYLGLAFIEDLVHGLVSFHQEEKFLLWSASFQALLDVLESISDFPKVVHGQQLCGGLDVGGRVLGCCSIV